MLACRDLSEAGLSRTDIFLSRPSQGRPVQGTPFQSTPFQGSPVQCILFMMWAVKGGPFWGRPFQGWPFPQVQYTCPGPLEGGLSRVYFYEVICQGWIFLGKPFLGRPAFRQMSVLGRPFQIVLSWRDQSDEVLSRADFFNVAQAQQR